MKEAEEYAEGMAKYYESAHGSIPSQFEKYLRKAVEYGYNKANEWHYVKDGDLPKDEDWKWCVSYRGYCYVAKYEEMFGCWTNQEYSEVMQPYAWKEIVLPKESE